MTNIADVAAADTDMNIIMTMNADADMNTMIMNVDADMNITTTNADVDMTMITTTIIMKAADVAVADMKCRMKM